LSIVGFADFCSNAGVGDEIELLIVFLST